MESFYFYDGSPTSTSWLDANIREPDPLSDEIIELRTQLLARMHELAHEHLTPHQLKVWVLFCAGLPYKQIAAELGTCKVAAARKTIWGNQHYSGKYKGKITGGIIKKLKLLVDVDPGCLEILAAIAAARQTADHPEEDWEISPAQP